MPNPKSRVSKKSLVPQTLPPRSAVDAADTWNLSSMFKSDADWEKVFVAWEKQIGNYAKFKGKLGKNAKTIAACLQVDADLDRAGERLGVYAFLKATEDQGNSTYQRMKGRYQHVATRASEEASFIRPELLAIPVKVMKAYLKAPEIKPWKLALERIVRFRPHTLDGKGEQLLAMQGQMSEASNQIFRQLNDTDLKWPSIEDEKGDLIELGHSSFSKFLHSPNAAVRKNAFHTYYAEYDKHKNTLAAALNGSVQRDVYYAKARGYTSAREGSLFHDNVPVSVYDNLVGAIHANLPALHRYYALRKKALKLKEIHQYDTYVPIVSGVDKHHTWDQAVQVVVDALAPLGEEYTRELKRGLTTSRWCDRYPNAGKSSGAFSYGTFDSEPYIMMNYQPSVMDHVFTLAHEAGHSMHSYYSAKHQPFQYYGYTIFVAEVASTFNEQLLLEHMLKKATSKKERAYLLNHAIDEIRGTIIRQTMFAEFEKISHELVEKGEPLTVETLRSSYRKLLEQYFGPDFSIDPVLELECMRIPHFYRAFYVYKYATGLSAAIALSQKVLRGGAKDLSAYLTFLQGGCSKWPLDLLRDAGVDMEKPQPVNAAMKRFGELVDELESLV